MRSHRRLWGDARTAVSLSSGPSYSRDADDGDPPYEPPRIRLGFSAPVAVRVVDPLLWDGDNA